MSAGTLPRPAGARSVANAERRHRDPRFGAFAGADARCARSRSHGRPYYGSGRGRRRLTRRHRGGSRYRRMQFPCCRGLARKAAAGGRGRSTRALAAFSAGPEQFWTRRGSARRAVLSSGRGSMFVPPCSAEPRRRSRDFVKRSRSWSRRSQPDHARSKACSSTPISTGRAAATPSRPPIRKAICFAASAGAGSRHCRPGHFRLILDLVKYIAELCRHDRR